MQLQACAGNIRLPESSAVAHRGTLLVRRRKQLGYRSQRAFAKAAGLHLQTIGRAEKNYDVSKKSLEQIEQFLEEEEARQPDLARHTHGERSPSSSEAPRGNQARIFTLDSATFSELETLVAQLGRLVSTIEERSADVEARPAGKAATTHRKTGRTNDR